MELNENTIQDIREVCESITSNFVREDYYSRDYCKFCGATYGNVLKIEGEPFHHIDCEVLKAKRILEELNKENENNGT
jgi:hypothetical protein